jgi:glucose/arabinose dehydrogenase
MFISNIGQHSVEEVNLGVKGAHYGWPFREGSFVFDVNANPEMVYRPSEQDLAADFVPPVIQYDHDEGNAVSGGFVYAGSQIPSLRNTYLFGDIPRGTLFSAPLSQIENGQQAKVEKVRLEINHNPSELIDIRPNERVDLRFGQNSSGEMFLFTKSNGKVYRIVDYKRKTASSAN